MNVSEAVTYSEDPQVEQFWAGACATMDIVLAEAKSYREKLHRRDNWLRAEEVAGNQDSRTIEIKQIHTKYEFGIDSMFRRNSYVEWPR